MKDKVDLKKLSLQELHEELLSLRKKQCSLRFKKANGSLEKTHYISQIRRAIARVKTVKTQVEAGQVHVK